MWRFILVRRCLCSDPAFGCTTDDPARRCGPRARPRLVGDAYGAEIRLARVKRDVRALLQRDGVIDKLGHDKIYGNVFEAAADHITGRAQP